MSELDRQRLNRIMSDGNRPTAKEEVKLWRGPYTITLTVVDSDRGKYEVIEKAVDKNRPTILGSGIFKSAFLPEVGDVTNSNRFGIRGAFR